MKFKNNLQLNKSEFYSGMLKIALPAMLQQFIVVVCNLADTVMAGRISEYALAGVGAANQIFFIIFDCIYEFLSGCANL